MQDSNLKERCVIRGQGEPILFAHGVAGPITVKNITDGLNNLFETIVPFFPGYLKEDGKIDYSDDLYTDFVENLRKEFNLEKINLVGFSLGGRTVINYTLQYPENVNKVIVIGPAGLSNPFSGLPFVRVWAPHLLNQLLKNPKSHARFASYDFIDLQSTEFENFKLYFANMMNNEIIRSNFSKISTEAVLPRKDWKQELPKSKIPMLIIWASNDKSAPIKSADKLKSMTKNSKLSILEGYGHMAVIENPDFFVKKIFKFLKI